MCASTIGAPVLRSLDQYHHTYTAFLEFASSRSTMRLVLYVFFFAAIEAARKARQVYWRAYWRTRNVRIGPGVAVSQSRDGAVVLKQGVSISTGTLLLCADEMRSPNSVPSRLIVAEDTAINEYCNIRACGGEILIGKNCLIAQMVSMVASNHSLAPDVPIARQLWRASPHSVHIGDDVWVGANATLLPGTRIGHGAVIAAGAVVRGNVPDGEIWGGVPARFLGRRA